MHLALLCVPCSPLTFSYTHACLHPTPISLYPLTTLYTVVPPFPGSGPYHIPHIHWGICLWAQWQPSVWWGKAGMMILLQSHWTWKTHLLA